MDGKAEAAVLHIPLLMVSLPLIFMPFALPIFAKSTGASALEIGGLFSVFNFVVLILRPLVGLGLDRYGRKTFIVGALIVYGAANLIFSAVFSFSDPLEGLFLGRIAQGIGASLLFITIDTITADLTTPAIRAEAMGRNVEQLSRGGMAGLMIWFVLAALMPTPAAWNITFLVYAGMSVAAALILYLRLPETRPRAGQANAGSENMSGGAAPRLGSNLLKLMTAAFLLAFANALIEPIYLIYLQDRFTIEMGVLAWAFFPAGLVFMFLPSRLGKLSDRFSRPLLMATGVTLTGVLYISLPSLPSLIWLVVLYPLSAIGQALSGPQMTAMVGDLSHGDRRGRIFGIYQMFSGLGLSVGPLVGGWLYDTQGGASPFIINGAILLSTAIFIALALGRNLGRDQVE